MTGVAGPTRAPAERRSGTPGARSAELRSRLTTGRAVVLACLLGSRVAYWIAGVRFDGHFIDAALQVADRDLLTHDTFSTVWYFHLQPPLFNLFLGIGFRLFGSWSGLGFQALYLLASVAIALNLLELLRGVGLWPRWAVAATVAVVVSPSFVEFENELFYVHAEILLLVVAARCLQRWAGGAGRGALVGFSASLTALALTRSLYHPVWLLVLAVALGVVCRGRARRAILLALAVPVVAGLLVATKNQVVFGWFTTGTLEGLNLHRVTEPQLSPSERRRLVSDGVITAVSTAPFSCADAAARYPHAGPYGHAGVLDRPIRAALPQYRFTNLNQRSAVPCLHALQSESLAVLRHQPVVLVRTAEQATAIFFYPTTPDARSGPANRSTLRLPGRVEAALLGSLGGPPSPYGADFGSFLPGHTEWVLVVAEPLGLVAAVALALRARRSGSGVGALLPAYLAWVLVTTLVVTQLTEVGENNRFRLTTIPLLVVALAAGAVAWRHGREPAAAARRGP